MTPQTPSPLISILMVNYNGLHHLQDCLQSLRQQTFRNFEIILVDNGSKDGSLEYLWEHYPEVITLDAKANLGFAGGNNFGLPHCRGRWIFFLNNDTALYPDCIERLVEATTTLPAIAYGCLLLDWQNPEKVDAGGDTLYKAGPAYSFRGLPTNHPIFQVPRSVTSLCAGAALWRADIVAKLSGFDEQFFLNFEDVDMCLRARHLGHDLWLVPAAKLLHKGSATIGHYTRTSVYYCTRNLFWLRLKNYPLPILLLHLPQLFVTGFMTVLIFASRGALGWWWEARRDQWRGLKTILAKRKQILSASCLSSREFEDLLRPGWLRERLAQRKRGQR